MLKDIGKLLFGSFTSKAPQTFSRRMNPMHYLPTQTANHDVDYVVGCINSAQQGDITRLLALYRDIEGSDATIQGAINTRKLSVLARGYSVQPALNSGAAGQLIADEVQAMLSRSESFIDACTWLLHGCVWPVSVVNKRWVAGGNRFSHPEFRNVPLELFDYTDRTLRIKEVGANGEPLTCSHTPDANSYLVHRGHMLMAPDIWGGPMRALIFWNLFSTQDREWWARFLERFGAPFLVGHYDKNDDDSRMVLERAFSEATRLFGVVATRETQISIESAGNTSGASDAFQKFHECAKDEKLMLILGQTLSSKASPTGIGGGASALQGEVREDVKLWDAFKLAQTIKSGVVVPYMRANGLQGPAPEVIFGGFNPADLAKMAEFLKSLGGAGLQLTDEGIEVVSKQAGITLERTKSAPVVPGLPPIPGQPPLAEQLALAASALPSVTLANESISSRGAAALSRAFSADLAPLAEIVASSRSREELIDRASGFLAVYRPHRAQEVLADALAAHAANALMKTVE